MAHHFHNMPYRLFDPLVDIDDERQFIAQFEQTKQDILTTPQYSTQVWRVVMRMIFDRMIDLCLTHNWIDGATSLIKEMEDVGADNEIAARLSRAFPYVQSIAMADVFLDAENRNLYGSIYSVGDHPDQDIFEHALKRIGHLSSFPTIMEQCLDHIRLPYIPFVAQQLSDQQLALATIYACNERRAESLKALFPCLINRPNAIMELNSEDTQQMAKREHKYDSDILTWFLQALTVKIQKDAIIDALQEQMEPNPVMSSRIKKI